MYVQYTQTIVYVGFTAGMGPNGHTFSYVGKRKRGGWHQKELTLRPALH